MAYHRVAPSFTVASLINIRIRIPEHTVKKQIKLTRRKFFFFNMLRDDTIRILAFNHHIMRTMTVIKTMAKNMMTVIRTTMITKRTK